MTIPAKIAFKNGKITSEDKTIISSRINPKNILVYDFLLILTITLFFKMGLIGLPHKGSLPLSTLKGFLASLESKMGLIGFEPMTFAAPLKSSLNVEATS